MDIDKELEAVKKDAINQSWEALETIRRKIEYAANALEAGDAGGLHVASLGIQSAANDLNQQAVRFCTATIVGVTAAIKYLAPVLEK